MSFGIICCHNSYTAFFLNSYMLWCVNRCCRFKPWNLLTNVEPILWNDLQSYRVNCFIICDDVRMLYNLLSQLNKIWRMSWHDFDCVVFNFVATMFLVKRLFSCDVWNWSAFSLFSGFVLRISLNSDSSYQIIH